VLAGLAPQPFAGSFRFYSKLQPQFGHPTSLWHQCLRRGIEFSALTNLKAIGDQPPCLYFLKVFKGHQIKQPLS
jgi:hypothetical protein